MYSLLLASLAALTLAQPSKPCMCSLDARRVADNFRDLIGQPFSSTLANDALSPSFTDYSDSVIELINAGCAGPLTLGDPTFTSRSMFIAGQSTQAPIPFDILKVWNTCDAVILRWRSPKPGFVQPEQEVTGIIVLETEPNPVYSTASPQPWLIHTVYSEFNSGAWLYDVGNITCAATANSTMMKRTATINTSGRGAFL